MTLTPEEIARLKSLMEKATPGKWVDHGGSIGVEIEGQTTQMVGFDVDGPLCFVPVPTLELHGPVAEAGDNDRPFIAALRNAAPSLLAAAERCGELEKNEKQPTWHQLWDANTRLSERAEAAESRATQAEARVRELENRDQESVDAISNLKVVKTNFSWVEELADGDPITFTYEEIKRMRDTLARIGGEA